MRKWGATRSSLGQSWSPIKPPIKDAKKIIIGSHLPSARSPRGQRAEIPKLEPRSTHMGENISHLRLVSS